jgi:hypothetical protein
MDLEPLDTRSRATPGNDHSGQPALRETSPASEPLSAAAEHPSAQWSAFVARILKPARGPAQADDAA